MDRGLNQNQHSFNAEIKTMHLPVIHFQKTEQTLLSTDERANPMDEFDRYRSEMNEKLLDSGHLGIKRFFALDTQAYEDGALDKRTKELMGLVGSIVLRCDDCITYHVKQCAANGVTREQFMDAFNVALVVGGSITIPHLRRAVDKLDQLL
jgi:AhpD family alkylhydroperoxidase